MGKYLSQSEKQEKIFVGIDVHLRSYAVSIVKEGELLKRWTMPAEPEDLIRILKRNYPKSEIFSAYEAGFSGFVLHRKLVKEGIKNIVVHAGAVAVKSNDRVKTDKRDSIKLAQQLESRMLGGIRIPSEEEEQKRQLTRLREQLVKARIRVMLQIRRRLVHFGYLLDYEGVLRRKEIEKFLETLSDGELRWCVRSQCRIWESLDEQIRCVEKRLAEQAKNCPFEIRYRQLPGIGRISARILANELGDMSHFRNEKALFCYVGLTPTEESSGETIRRGHISRQGKGVLRKILVECAWVAIRNDQSLRRYYMKLNFRVGAKRAIVAVARKLIGRARAIFNKGEDYRGELLAHEAKAA